MLTMAPAYQLSSLSLGFRSSVWARYCITNCKHAAKLLKGKEYYYFCGCPPISQAYTTLTSR